jgi:hypothetical protein
MEIMKMIISSNVNLGRLARPLLSAPPLYQGWIFLPPDFLDNSFGSRVAIHEDLQGKNLGLNPGGD